MNEFLELDLCCENGKSFCFSPVISCSDLKAPSSPQLRWLGGCYLCNAWCDCVLSVGTKYFTVLSSFDWVSQMFY